MDWSKTKTILISMLLLLNVFLFSSILYSNSSYKLNSDYIRYAENILKSRNVTTKIGIPTYSAPSGKMTYVPRQISEEHLAETLLGVFVLPDNQEFLRVWKTDGKSLEIGNNLIIFKDSHPTKSLSYDKPDKMAAELKQYLKDLKLLANDIVVDKIQLIGDNYEVLLIERYKGQLLFDNYIRFEVSREGISSFELVTRDIKKIIGLDDVLSAYQVLVMSQIPENSVIKRMDFGYKRIKEGELYDSPVWRVEYEDGNTSFYNAYTGEKLD